MENLKDFINSINEASLLDDFDVMMQAAEMVNMMIILNKL